MKCPLCSAEIPDGAKQCSVCGCSIVYNGIMSEGSSPAQPAASESKQGALEKLKAMPAPQKLGLVIAALLIVIVVSFLFKPQGSSSGSSGYNPPATQANGGNEVHDWMKDQAEGKDYGDDDGGDYYCMGKNDTCPNKTHNKYDLYCDSCDPDGDNVEG